MLPKANRLHTSQEIYHTRKEGNRTFSQFFTLFSVSTPENLEPRFAFVVSSKVSKNATARNRTKRLLRQAVHELLPTIVGSTCTVCVAKADLSEVPLQAIKADITRTFKKAGLLKN